MPRVGPRGVANDLNATAGMRCVNHASTPHVDADVTQAEEEEHVSRLHTCGRYLTTAVIECVGAVWEFDTETPVRPIDETRAVEDARREAATPAIRHSHFSDGDRGHTFANGALVRVPRGLVPGRCRRRSVRHWTRAADEERGKCERQHGAARGDRQRRERTTGR